ncbi:MAG: DUF2721 domain-containing protein [Gemmatimonadaceae bacterium]|nr:DUF2721 domain-containing protein [Gemmatimonadaceae bacterium]
MQVEPTATIARVIQLSVAPVFLLMSVTGLLNVLTGRLARVIDRARVIERDRTSGDVAEERMALERLHTLAVRARWINIAISLSVASAIFVASVVAVLFASAFWGTDYRGLVAGLFISAMAALIVGLIYFLREISLATSSLRIGRQ